MKKITLLLLALVPTFAFAAWEDVKPTQFTVENPPARGSDLEKRELEGLHRLEQTRTREECAMGERQTDPAFDNFFEDERDFTLLTRDEISKGKRLVERAMEVADGLVDHYKDKYMRPRPYTTDRTLRPCITKPWSSRSFPSGHATKGYAGACVFALIYPAKKAELEKYGLLLGNLRVIGGVHYPSDVAAGQKLAADFCQFLSQDPGFQEELKRIQ